MVIVTCPVSWPAVCHSPVDDSVLAGLDGPQYCGTAYTDPFDAVLELAANPMFADKFYTDYEPIHHPQHGRGFGPVNSGLAWQRQSAAHPGCVNIVALVMSDATWIQNSMPVHDVLLTLANFHPEVHAHNAAWILLGVLPNYDGDKAKDRPNTGGDSHSVRSMQLFHEAYGTIFGHKWQKQTKNPVKMVLGNGAEVWGNITLVFGVDKPEADKVRCTTTPRAGIICVFTIIVVRIQLAIVAYLALIMFKILQITCEALSCAFCKVPKKGDKFVAVNTPYAPKTRRSQHERFLSAVNDDFTVGKKGPLKDPSGKNWSAANPLVTWTRGVRTVHCNATQYDLTVRKSGINLIRSAFRKIRTFSSHLVRTL